MATFKETREILLASYASNIIMIEEYTCFSKKTVKKTWIFHTITTHRSI